MPTRTTLQGTEVVYVPPDPPSRITILGVEVIYRSAATTPSALTQIGLEVISDNDAIKFDGDVALGGISAETGIEHDIQYATGESNLGGVSTDGDFVAQDTYVRITQYVVEGLYQANTPTLNITQINTEILSNNVPPPLRASQVVVEILIQVHRRLTSQGWIID